MLTEEDLLRAAGAAALQALPGEAVAAVLAARPPGAELVYLCALRGPGEALAWTCVDAGGALVSDEHVVREAATVVALAETAEEAALAASASDLAARAHGAREHADDAALASALDALAASAGELDQLTARLRVASAAYVDRIGLAASALADALARLQGEAEALSQALSGTPGDPAEPLAREVWGILAEAAAAGRPDRFADALTGATGPAAAYADDVIESYRPPLGAPEEKP